MRVKRDAPQERLALLYSDGSMGVMPRNETLDKALEERVFADVNETNPHHLTKVATVRIQVVEVLFNPVDEILSKAGVCKLCGKVK